MRLYVSVDIQRNRNACRYSISFYNNTQHIQMIFHYAVEWPNILQTRHDNCI